MELEGQYLTFNDYKGLGGTLDLMPFKILEFEARRRIDIRTFNRLKDLEEIPIEVKMCEYALINSISNYVNSTNSASGNVASENTDGYSISYITADRISDIVKSKSDELEDIIRNYLLEVIIDGEHIMYCGVE